MSSSVTFSSKPTMANGEPVPVGQPSPVKAVLAIVLNHTAEVFQAVVEAVAEHYKLDKEEMMSVIVAHPAYTGVTLNPVLNDLGFLGAPAASEPAASEPKKRQWSPEAKARAAAKRAAKAAAPSTEAAAPPTETAAPKKKKFIFKKPGDTSSTVSSTS